MVATRANRVLRHGQPAALVAGAFALFFGGAFAMSCAGASPRPDGEACDSDDGCSSGFCDLARCSEPSSQFPAYGQECASPGPNLNSGPIGYSGTENGRFGLCGGFLCIDGRCRSCTSAQQ